MPNGNGKTGWIITTAFLLASTFLNIWLASAIAQRKENRVDIRANTAAIGAIREQMGRIETKVDILIGGSSRGYDYTGGG